MTPYQAWEQAVQAHGSPAEAGAVTWPFSDQYHGLAAARYTGALYAELANAGELDTTTPTRANSANTTIYVLAPPDVQASSPKTMSAWQKFLNAGFTYGDEFADTVGLPSLATIEGALNPFGLSITTLKVAAGVGVAVLLWTATRRR